MHQVRVLSPDSSQALGGTKELHNRAEKHRGDATVNVSHVRWTITAPNYGNRRVNLKPWTDSLPQPTA